MASDFDAFIGDDEGAEPPDGEHTAILNRLAVRNTKNGTALKSEWQTDDRRHWWESWHNTSGGGKKFTLDMLDALGIDRAQLKGKDWVDLEDALVEAENRSYTVRVRHSADGRFINTDVVGVAADVQRRSDIPADTTGLPPAASEPSPSSSGVPEKAAASSPGKDLFGDDDIPFRAPPPRFEWEVSRRKLHSPF